MISEIIILVILIMINAFFAATEMAFISINDAKIEIMAKEGKKKAITIAKMLKNPSRFLATIQIGITLAGFLSSAFASDTFANMIAPVLNNIFPSINLETWRGISIIIITIILSYFTLIFGELVPKRLAMKWPEKVAFASVNIIKVIANITKPFVIFLEKSTNVVSKIFGVSETDEETVTEEEIRMMVDVGGQKGTINNEEKEMINNVFELNDKVASEIMTPRIDIFALEENTLIEEAIKEIHQNYRYSRVPIYNEDIDEITGILYVKDMLLEAKGKNIKVKKLAKEVYFIPETKKVNEIFKEMRKNKKQIAVVLDEYGGTAGIVTMEDILEELVGDIFDEFDEFENEYEKIDDNTFILDGGISIYDCEKILNIEIPDGDYDTLSGYLIEILGRIPENEENPIIETDKINYKIEEYKDRRIIKVKACKNNTL